MTTGERTSPILQHSKSRAYWRSSACVRAVKRKYLNYIANNADPYGTDRELGAEEGSGRGSPSGLCGGNREVGLEGSYGRGKRSQRAVEHNGKCSNCKQRVLSVHYQCTECPDYDLCASCEALPVPVHSPAHPMVKIKSPNSAAYALTLRARVPRPIINSAADISSSSDSLSQPMQVLMARLGVPVPNINSAAVMHSSSDLLSQPMQASRRLLRLLEDDTIIPSQPMQAESSRMGQEQSLPRAQMNAQPPMPPPHEMGLWEMKLEPRSPYTYTVCGRARAKRESGFALLLNVDIQLSQLSATRIRKPTILWGIYLIEIMCFPRGKA
ncbi:hypothetical protein FIBSPDRAFT_1023333 [Athelia psychrophila]|uniref:ZZ-type domain-containing protein n=1 Tax=Athelia psychrophila TaxID=1759441 RepID=A0A166IRB1_9AGAM|nr:hypothetical protein FIBSPDRAFT_1023333 [Fibularhizoctonia sp. CBS 109695]